MYCKRSDIFSILSFFADNVFHQPHSGWSYCVYIIFTVNYKYINFPISCLEICCLSDWSNTLCPTHPKQKLYILKTFEDIPYLLEGAGVEHVSYIPNVANEIQIVFDVIDAAVNA